MSKTETNDNATVVHHGRNVRFAREFWKSPKVTQEDLALKLGVNQKDISKLEGQKTITDNMLHRLAEALEVPYQFLKECPLEESIKKIVQNHGNSHTFNDNSSENLGNELDIKFYDTENAKQYVDKIADLSQKLGKAIAERDIYKQLYEENK